MKREIITISENGVITIPSVTIAPILMRDFEIAELFGIYSPTVKAAIKAILKSGQLSPTIRTVAKLRVRTSYPIITDWI